MAAVVEKLTGLINECGTALETDRVNEIVMELFELLDSIKNLEEVKDETILSLFRCSGIKLWNHVIAWKTGQNITQAICAKGRYVAVQLTYMATFADTSQTIARKQLAMALKTGRDWLDCNNKTLADKCFVLATECYIKLIKLMEDPNKNTHLTPEQQLECHENMLRTYTFRSEIALAESQHAGALEFYGKAKELLLKCPKQIALLYEICYNFGLDCYQKELYSYSTVWLRESISIGKKDQNWDAERKGTTYQLLGHVCMLIGGSENLQSALEYIELSIQANFDMKSVLLKVKIMMLLEKPHEELIKLFFDVCLDPLLDLKIALQYVNLFAEKKKFDVCYECLDILNKKYPRSNENVKVQINKLECLLTEQKTSEAEEIIERELGRVQDSTGIVFEKSMLKQLQLILWGQAQVAFELKDYLKALKWYDYSLKFMQRYDEDSLNMAKLQRNRCCCLMELENYEEAMVAATDAEQNDKDSPQVYFFLFKIYVLNKSDDRAKEVLEKLSVLKLERETKDDVVHGLVCLAAQFAFEHGNMKLAEIALEKIMNYVTDSSYTLVTLRSELDVVIKLVEKAYQMLTTSKEEFCNYEDEIVWFNKISWNLGLSCVDHPMGMLKSFMLCYQFSLLLHTEMVDLSQQKSCLLMAAGGGLQAAKSCAGEKERNELLQQVYGIIEKFYVVYERIKNGTADFQDSTLRYLLCYEYEVKLKLGHTDLEEVMEKVMQLPGEHAAVLENFASVAFSTANGEQLGINALKLAIKCMLEVENIDFMELSKCIHNLISVSLRNGSVANAESKEEAYNLYQDTLKIIEKIGKGSYPEIELVWLMTKAWNCGIRLYSAHQHEPSVKWCSLSMKFLNYLQDLKANYEPHMSTVFADILSRTQQMEFEE